ncbi:MFS transporter [Prosthecomicrobium sp. N25]|uniref:MFS transporter n=1 Tax=Prosthecomicrobium sp. N25 TaxID=3129254 RepID=UPI003077C73A
MSIPSAFPAHAVQQAGADPASSRRAVLALSTFGMAAAFGGLGTVGVLIQPFQAELGWPRAETSFAYLAMTMGAAAGGLIAGRLTDRLATGPIAAVGIVIMGLGLMILQLQPTVERMQLVYFGMGLLGFSCLYAPLLTTVSLWHRRSGGGLALGILTAGGAAGQAIVPAVFQMLVVWAGWREATLILGLGYVAVVSPVMLGIRKPEPGEAEPAAGAAAAGAWPVSPVLATGLVAVAGLFCCGLMGVPTVHLLPLGEARGLGTAAATLVVTLTMVSACAGRITAGLIIDRLGSLASYMVVSAMQTTAVLGLAMAQGFAPVAAFGILYGFGFGGAMTALVCCTRDAVPARRLGTAMSVVGLLAWGGMGAGGYQGGLCFDLTGGYALSYGLAAASGLVNLGALALLAGLIRRGRARAA